LLAKTRPPPPHSTLPVPGNYPSSLYLSITGYRIRIGKHKSGYTPGTKPRGIRELPPPRAENETRCCKTQPTGFFFVFFLAPKRQHSTPAPARQHALTARPAPATTQQWPTMHVARRQLPLVRAGPRWKSSSHAKALSYETKIKALPPHSTVSKPPRWHHHDGVCLSVQLFQASPPGPTGCQAHSGPRAIFQFYTLRTLKNLIAGVCPAVQASPPWPTGCQAHSGPRAIFQFYTLRKG